MKIAPWVWLIFLILIVVLIFSMGNRNRQRFRTVGVGQSRVAARMNLKDKLNPAILPDLLKEILREMTPNQKPDTEKFQQEVVRKLSQRIMDDSEINYRVDLNNDGNLDPVMVIPESVNKEAAVYSIRVPDPAKYPKDPSGQSNWDEIAKEGIELCALSVAFDETAKKLVVDAAPNEYLYQGSPRHYRSEYPAQQHSWMETYFTYMIFRDILFGPYLWFRPGWYGGWYGPWYGGWHAPVYTRPVTVTRTRYRTASSSSSPIRTRSGSTLQSSKAKTRTRPPTFVSRGASRSSSRTSSSRSRGFSRTFSNTARGFRGGSRGTGK